MLDDFLKDITGLVHIGANEGQERYKYHAASQNVLWIEALPEAFDRLQQNIAGFPNQRGLRALVADVSGKAFTFHVANNEGQSSSIYEFALHPDIWPTIHFTHDITIQSSSLDDLVRINGIGRDLYQGLVMDTQGSELLVLQGADTFLRNVRYIKTEAADFESYKGATTVDELTAYLKTKNFVIIDKEAFASREGGGSYYDILFKRI